MLHHPNICDCAKCLLKPSHPQKKLFSLHDNKVSEEHLCIRQLSEWEIKHSALIDALVSISRNFSNINEGISFQMSHVTADI